jgi:hypothetical protein
VHSSLSLQCTQWYLEIPHLRPDETLKQRDVEGISLALGIVMLKLVVVYLRAKLLVIAD